MLKNRYEFVKLNLMRSKEVNLSSTTFFNAQSMVVFIGLAPTDRNRLSMAVFTLPPDLVH